MVDFPRPAGNFPRISRVLQISAGNIKPRHGAAVLYYILSISRISRSIVERGMRVRTPATTRACAHLYPYRNHAGNAGNAVTAGRYLPFLPFPRTGVGREMPRIAAGNEVAP